MPNKEDEGLSFFNVSEDLVASPKHKPAATSALDFDGILPTPLKLHEDLTEGCGGQLWPAGMVLAKYLLKQPKESLKNRRILELGAGGGLVGLAVASHIYSSSNTLSDELARCTPLSKIQLTDQAPLIPLLKHNITLNALEPYVVASVLDWGTPVLAHYTAPDIILAADCVYFEPAFPLLLKTLRELISTETTCYFCFKKRRRADMRFINDLKKSFVVEDLLQGNAQIVDGFEQCGREGIFLYKVTGKLGKG